MKKLILWDFNGVIIDDAQACYQADLILGLHFGGRRFSFEEWQRNISIPSIDFYAKFGCSRDELKSKGTEMGEVFHSAYEPLADKCELRKGVKETLAAAAEEGLESVICSNHTTDEIRKQLTRFEIEAHFSAVVANSQKKTSHVAQTKLGRVKFVLGSRWKPDEAFIIGDSVEEIKIGQELGITTVAVCGGYHHWDRLVTLEPDHLILQVDQLIPIINV